MFTTKNALKAEVERNVSIAKIEADLKKAELADKTARSTIMNNTTILAQRRVLSEEAIKLVRQGYAVKLVLNNSGWVDLEIRPPSVWTKIFGHGQIREVSKE